MTSRLNERQLTLLRRIADGREPVRPSEHHLAVSIYALRSRRLVTTTGLRRFWTAALTELGRSVLKPGAHSDSTRASPASLDKEAATRAVPIDQLAAARVEETTLPVQTPTGLPVTPPAVPVPARLGPGGARRNKGRA